VRLLTGGGHQVVCLSRSAANDAEISAHGGIARTADIFDAESLARAAEGCEVFVHAATAIPAGTKMKPSEWEMNDRIRRDGTVALSTAAAKVGARGYVQQSVVFVARPKDQLPFDENFPVRAEGLYRSSVDAEELSREAGVKHGYPVAVLRGAMFYSADSRHTLHFADQLRRRLLPIIDEGDNLMTLVHADDAASAFVAATERVRGGLWHITDNEPVTMEAFLNHFAQVIEAKPPHHVPALLARMAAGDEAVAFMTASTSTNSRKFQSDFGWKPAFPSYREGLHQVAEEWKKQSTAKDNDKVGLKTQ